MMIVLIVYNLCLNACMHVLLCDCMYMQARIRACAVARCE